MKNFGVVNLPQILIYAKRYDGAPLATFMVTLEHGTLAEIELAIKDQQELNERSTNKIMFVMIMNQ